MVKKSLASKKKRSSKKEILKLSPPPNAGHGFAALSVYVALLQYAFVYLMTWPQAKVKMEVDAMEKPRIYADPCQDGISIPSPMMREVAKLRSALGSQQSSYATT